MLIWKTEKRKVIDLKIWDQNPRTISELNFEKLKERIQKRGFHDIIKIDADGTILSGNQRKEALLQLGAEEVDVRIPNRKLTEKERKEIALESNRNDGEWDWDKLANEFEEDLLKDIGFTEKELAGYFEPEITEDEVPDIRKTGIKLGDIFKLGENRLMCGDADKKEDVESLMDGKKADLFLTDPPYGISYVEKNASVNGGIVKNAIGKKIENDTQTVEDISYKIWLPAFENAHDFTTHEASYLIFSCQGGDLMMMMMMMMIHKAKWKVLHMLIWVKQNFVFGRSDYHYQHEPILFGWKKGEKHNFYAGRKETSVLEYDRPYKSDLHPTTKPITLLNYLINNHTKKDDLILDLFLGSGSTLIAAEQSGRKCYGMEIDPQYVQVVIDRWKKFTGKKAEKIKRN